MVGFRVQLDLSNLVQIHQVGPGLRGYAFIRLCFETLSGRMSFPWAWRGSGWTDLWNLVQTYQVTTPSNFTFMLGARWSLTFQAEGGPIGSRIFKMFSHLVSRIQYVWDKFQCAYGNIAIWSRFVTYSVSNLCKSSIY